MSGLEKMVANAYLSDPSFRINYLVPHTDQDLELASPWQGATQGLVQTAHLFERALSLPADVREICASWSNIATFRCMGLIAHRIIPVEFSAFAEATRQGMWPPFRCVLSTADTADFVDSEIIANSDEWLHLSDAEGPGRILVNSATWKDIFGYVKRRVEKMINSPDCQFAEVCDSVLQGELPGSKVVNLHSSRHNLTRPNDAALESFGCVLGSNGRGDSPRTEKNAIRWIAKSFDFVGRRRRDLVPASIIANAFILSVSSSYRRVTSRHLIAQIARNGPEPKLLRQILRSLMKPRGYMLNFPGIDCAQGVVENRLAQLFIALRQQELALYTTVLTRISAEALLPTLRLSPQVNLASGMLKHLAECSRRPGPRKREKRLGLFKKIQTILNEGVDPLFQGRINLLGDRAEGIKLVSDLPLEWLHSEGIPLMLRHECSRIPLTPISAAFGVATNLDPVLVAPSQLADVLVIRSFAEEDPIREVLKKGIDGFCHLAVKRPVNVRFVDVQTEDQLVDAINTHMGAIIIFDCHGKFDSDVYVASLIIGENAVYLWTLREKITRMAPIVVLSACDTAPLDGSHASAGASMLLLGAKTVLASFLPVNAIHAAVMIGRLIYRIGEFVPIALAHRTTVTWREIVAGMLKMSHLTETLMAVHRQGHIDVEQYRTLHLQGNRSINEKRTDWFEDIVKGVASATDLSKPKALHLLETCAGLTDAMLYTQLGHPELIFLSELDASQMQAMVGLDSSPALK